MNRILVLCVGTVLTLGVLSGCNMTGEKQAAGQGGPKGKTKAAEKQEKVDKTKINMLVAYDAFSVKCLDDDSINVRGGRGRGYRGLKRTFPAGHNYRVTGDLGWSAQLYVDQYGNKEVSDVKAGARLVETPEIFIADDGAFEVKFGRVPEFHFRIPVDWGAWTIGGAYGERPGYRWVALPDGDWLIEGDEWQIPFRVRNGELVLKNGLKGIKANQITVAPGAALKLSHKDVSLESAAALGKPVAFLTKYQKQKDKYRLIPVRKSEIQLHGQKLEVSDGAFVGAAKAGKTVLAVKANQREKGLRCNTVFLRGGKNWTVSGSIEPIDPSVPVDAKDLALKAGEDVTVNPNVPSGAYLLKVTAQAPEGENSCTARAAVARKGKPETTGSLWLPEGRTAYKADEGIDVYTWQEQPANATLLARRENAGESVLAEGELSGLCRITPDTFSPGEVELLLRAGDRTLARRTITILPVERISNFLIMSYASVLDNYDAVEKLDNLGITGFLEQKGTRFGVRGRLDGLSRGLAENARWLPAIGPADRYAPRRDKFLEFLDRKRWRIYAQWGSAHQPWGYGTSFRDHIVVNRLAASSAWSTMAGRQHPSFMGMNIFDEGGTARGPRPYDDATRIEYDYFEKKFGREKPRYVGQDKEAARAWIYDKQRQHHNVYAGIGEVLDQINRYADPGSFAYLGTQNGNLNSMAVDGGHPPIAYKSITRSTMHWYPGYFWKAFILLGNEYHFMQPQDIEFMPLIWSDGDIDLTRHEVSLAVTRQVDGIAHFHWSSMIPEAYFEGEQTEEVERYVDVYQNMHKRLKRIGGLLRTIRRDRDSEVAVLYSLYDFAHRLLPAKDDAGHAYNAAYHAAYTGYCTLISLLRSGVQAGWLSEEEIMRENALQDREVLILPEITDMRPALKRRIRAFIREGGAVFTDKGTTVELKGAEELPLDFGKLARESKRDTEKATNFAPMFIPDVRPVIREHVAPLVDNVVDTSAPKDLLVTRHVNGEGEYFLGVNGNMHPREELPELDMYERQDLWESLEAEMTLPAEGVVYDILGRTKVATADGAAKVDVDLEAGELCAFAVLPEAIGEVNVNVTESLPRKNSAPIRAQIVGESGDLLDAAVPIRVTFQDADGNSVRATRFRSTDSGQWRGEFTAGVFDPGTVKIIVREMLTGKTASATVEIGNGDTAAEQVDKAVIAENEAAMTRFFRSNAVYELPTLLDRNQVDYNGLFDNDLHAVYIALGNRSPDPEAVKPLARFLASQGVDVEIRRASDLAVKGFDEFVGRGVHRITRDIVNRMRNDIEVDRPVIAIGSPADNELINLSLWDRRWTYRTSLGGFPGSGQAYVTHLWRPFSLRHNSLIAVANDPEAVGKAVDYLLEKARRAYGVKR